MSRVPLTLRYLKWIVQVVISLLVTSSLFEGRKLVLFSENVLFTTHSTFWKFSVTPCGP